MRSDGRTCKDFGKELCPSCPECPKRCWILQYVEIVSGKRLDQVQDLIIDVFTSPFGNNYQRCLHIAIEHYFPEYIPILNKILVLL